MNQEIIEVSTVNMEVYDRLRIRIKDGDLKPGEKVSIRQIAEAFGVSTMPVREAIKRLQAEGFVKLDRRSIVIRELSLSEVKEIFSIRQRLETLATEWALPNITTHDLLDLKEIVKRMGNPHISHSDWERLNYEFHLQFYELSKSETLLKLIKNVWDSVTPYMYIFLSSVQSLQKAQLEHLEFIKLIEERNLDDLLDLTKKHLQYTCDEITEALENETNH